tara:strand:- start:1563 stop:2534 length:972 start_codon:yes stop_codon:yes gene_type:complete
MNDKNIKLSNKIQEEQIFACLSKTYQSSITLFYEFERTWLTRTYKVFKDLDKYIILVFLLYKTFKSYHDMFHKKNYESFYNQKIFEIPKINIIDISRELSISKETARRKILELEKAGIIKKVKKTIILNQEILKIQRPDETLDALCKFLSNFSRVMRKENILKKDISTEEFKKIIKDNFTLCWYFFLDFQIPYCLAWKKVYGDLETFFIVGIIIYNQNLHLQKDNKLIEKNFFKNYTRNLISLGNRPGINAMSIADITGIPRPTILRKLNLSMGKGIVSKDKKNLYRISKKESLIKNLNNTRVINMKNLSIMMTKIYNLALKL